MADIINLNKKRKAKIRLEKEKKASENRFKFGRTKKEKQLEKQDNERHERHLDGHQLEKKRKNKEGKSRVATIKVGFKKISGLDSQFK